MKKQIRLRGTFSMLLLALLCCINPAYSQVTATGTDNILPTGYDVSDLTNINCDVIDIPGKGKLVATVYDLVDNISGNPYCQARIDFFNTSGTITFSAGPYDIPGNVLTSYGNKGLNPDVVIANDLNGTLDEDYRVAVIYETGPGGSHDVELNFIDLTGIGTTSPAASTTWVGSPMILNTNNTAMYPHIDLRADLSQTTLSGTSYALNDFAASWVEPIGGILNVVMTTGDVSAGTFNTPITVSSVPSGQNISDHDVAFRTPATSGGPDGVAYVTYQQYNGTDHDLRLAIINDNSGTLSAASNSIISAGNTEIYRPRIECKPLGDDFSTTGEATYEVAATIKPVGGTIYETHTFNDAATSTVCTVSTADHHLIPVVTGVGQDICPSCLNIGNTQFTVSYYSFYTHNPGGSNGDFFANSIDISSGTISTYTSTYEINSNALNNNAYTWTYPYMAMIATATSSNTGDDLFTVWHDSYNGTNGDIRYKFSGNSYAYKTTGISNTKVTPYTIYPNPVADILNIKGNIKATYTITDVVGKTLQTGNIEATDNVAVGNLAPGTYILQLASNNENYFVKFVKQ